MIMKNNPKESTIIKEIWENYSSNSQYPLAFNSLNEVLNMNYTPFNECFSLIRLFKLCLFVN